MKQAKSPKQFDSLHNIFSDIIDNGERDPIERIVVLTYEFDDLQLLNLLSQRRLEEETALHKNDLKFIDDTKPVVIYDARKTSQYNQLPHFLDLIPVHAAPFSCHHAKAYLIITRHAFKLVLGSFNLTSAGLFSNREVFIDFTWSEKERHNTSVLRSFSQLLRDGYAKHAQAASSASLKEVVTTIEERLATWDKKPATPGSGPVYHLLASGYVPGQTGLKQLTALWRDISDQPPRKLIAVSPFFDCGRSLLIDTLQQALGPIKDLTIYTDAANACISKQHYGKTSGKRSLHLIPEEISEEELQRISAANEVKLDKLRITRALHAKILILCGDRQQHLVYIGSANFTQKAWNGSNHELGLAWMVTGEVQALVDTIAHSLSASPECHYATLQESPPAISDDDEDVLYTSGAGYPSFIERIELQVVNDQHAVQFTFFTDTPERLADYTIRWGDLTVVLNDRQSQVLPWESAREPFLNNRNLSFTLAEQTEIIFYLPYNHDAALSEHSDVRLYSTPEEWLLHFTQPGRGAGKGSNENIPGEPPTPPESQPQDVDRDSNVVIAMQRHLNLFAVVEHEFEQRIKEIATLPDSEGQLKRRVEASLLRYVALLEHERDQSKSSSAIRGQAYSFKVGELALFCNRMAAVMPQMKTLARSLGRKLPTGPAQSDSQEIYLAYCRNELK